MNGVAAVGDYCSVGGRIISGSGLLIHSQIGAWDSLDLTSPVILRESLSVFKHSLLQTMTVAGPAYFADALSVDGRSSLTSTLSVSREVQLVSTLSVDSTGKTVVGYLSTFAETYFGGRSVSILPITKLGDVLTVYSQTRFGSGLSIQGSLFCKGSAESTGALRVGAGGMDILSEARFADSISCRKPAYFETGLSASGFSHLFMATSLYADLEVASSTVLKDRFSVAELGFIGSPLSVGDSLYAGYGITVSSATKFGDIISSASAVMIGNGALSVCSKALFGNSLSSSESMIAGSSISAYAVKVGCGSLKVSGDSFLNHMQGQYLALDGGQRIGESLTAVGAARVGEYMVVHSALTVQGMTHMLDFLSVDGQLVSKGRLSLSDILSIESCAFFGTDCGVYGLLAAGALSVGGYSRLGCNLSITNGCLYVHGTSSMSDSLHLDGPLVLSNNLSVLGMISANDAAVFRSTVSVTSELFAGDHLDVHNTAKFGSSVDQFGETRFHADSRLDGSFHVGETLSVKGESEIYSNLSVFADAVVYGKLSTHEDLSTGSFLSVAQLGFIGGDLSVSLSSVVLDLSVCGKLNVFGGLSSNSGCFILSGLSISDISSLGLDVSVMGSFNAGSSMSVAQGAVFGHDVNVRSQVILGSCLSVAESLHAGQQASISDTLRCGRLITEGFIDIQGELTVGNQVHLCNSLSVDSITAINSFLSTQCNACVQGYLSLGDNIRLGSVTDVYAEADKVMTLSRTGGFLHGLWESSVAISTSDRRLKRKITPLLRDYAANATLNLLDKLRPVAYEMIDDESGRKRYGFIAQELEDALPSLVVDSDEAGDGEGTKAVLYQDIIAILTVAMQLQQDEISNLKLQLNQTTAMREEYTNSIAEVEDSRRLLELQAKRIEKLEKLMDQFITNTTAKTDYQIHI